MRTLYFIIICILFTVQKAYTQSESTIPLLTYYHSALQSYNEASFAESYDAFLNLEKQVIDPNSLFSLNISFYKCKSALKLFHDDAPKMMLNFLETYPNNVHFNEANVCIADYYYQKRSYTKSTQYYSFVDENSLQSKRRDNFNFKYAYSLFSIGESDKASFLFQELLLSPSDHQTTSKYYLACIAYQNLNFSTAEKYFLELIELGLYMQDAPMYLVNIYHQQHSFKQVISFGLNYTDSLNIPSREIYKLIAEAYYREKTYDKAIYYFKDKYLSLEDKLDAQGYYLLGQSYYKLNEYAQASSAFNKIIQADDSLTQNAYYYLGDCYLNLKDKRSAQNAFESASNYDFNLRITEHSSFNFAKLCYELGYPYADPTMILQDFINDFPDSEYLDEAYSYLVNAFLTHKDYSRAIKSMEINGLENIFLQQAYQEVSYYRAVQLFNDGFYKRSIAHFDKALIYSHNKSYESLSYFWRAESYFRLGQFEISINSYQEFQHSPMSSALPEFESASYHIAYANFKLWHFSEALFAFESFAGSADPNDVKLHDTYTRMGDCHYMLKEYSKAINDYMISVSHRGVDSDYAAYQVALAYQQMKDYNEVVQQLINFQIDFPKSTYIDDALYRMGESYIKLDQPGLAIDRFRQIENQYPSSAYLADAKMKIGLVLYNKENYIGSIDEFKNIVSKYPATDIAREAINNARSAYVDIGDVNSYAEWLEALSFVIVNPSTIDSTSYESAELQYLKGNHEKSFKNFTAYLKNFPKGVFKLPAQFYLGKSAIELDSLDIALNAFESVNSYYNNVYSLPALMQSAQLYHRLEEYSKAIVAYSSLDDRAETVEAQLFAKQGLMECLFAIGEYDQAIEEAQIVLNSGRVDKRLILKLNTFLARAAFLNLDRELAMEKYSFLNDQSEGELKAEAMYHIAYLSFYEGDLEKSKETIFEQSRLLPRYTNWLGKSFVLLAKNYWEQNDVFQAKHTLDQLILNMNDPIIIKEAKQLKFEILFDTDDTSETDLTLGINLIPKEDSILNFDSLIIKKE